MRESAPQHHDRLTALERDPLGALVELIEMATTWHELEYGLLEPVIGPDRWVDFAREHEWANKARVVDLMISLMSIARPRRVRGAESESYSSSASKLASVTSLHPGPAVGAES